MKVLLFGDVFPTPETEKMFEQVQTDALFTDVRSLFDDADFAFVNLECPLTDCDTPIVKIGPPLKAPFNTAKVLKELGVNCCGMSNNHAFDYGPQGIRDTRKTLDEVGIDYTGFGENYEDSRKNYVFEKNGQKITIITVSERNFSYASEDRMGCRPFDEFDTIADIRKAKAESDRVIVLYHGAKENCRYPSPRVRKVYRAMVDNGADVVINQHTHCIGSYENYNDGHILHGQGNFHFIRHNRPEGWFSSLATIYNTETNDIEFLPIATDKYSISLAKGEAAQKIMDDFHARSEELHNGKWKDGWHEFCESQRGQYLEVLKNMENAEPFGYDYNLLAHFIDCQANIDAWSELFPPPRNQHLK